MVRGSSLSNFSCCSVIHLLQRWANSAGRPRPAAQLGWWCWTGIHVFRPDGNKTLTSTSHSYSHFCRVRDNRTPFCMFLVRWRKPQHTEWTHADMGTQHCAIIFDVNLIFDYLPPTVKRKKSLGRKRLNWIKYRCMNDYIIGLKRNNFTVFLDYYTFWI